MMKEKSHFELTRARHSRAVAHTLKARRPIDRRLILIDDYPTQMERRDWSDSFVYVTIQYCN